MHYYQYNIKEFRAGTWNMSRLARSLYRDMLDIIYDTEKPLPDSLDIICQELGVTTAEERETVAGLLIRKFVQVEGGYMNERAATEIVEYHKKADTARENGKGGGRPRKPKANPEQTGKESTENPAGSSSEPTANPAETGSKANQEPITSNQDKTPHTPQGGIGVEDAPQRKSRGITLKTFLADCKAKDERPIRDYESLWRYTRSAGLPDDFVALAWVEFCRRYGDGGTGSAKVYQDWRKAFRKYVEGNYLKLWAIGQDGSYFLTTQGKQAEAVAEAA